MTTLIFIIAPALFLLFLLRVVFVCGRAKGFADGYEATSFRRPAWAYELRYGLIFLASIVAMLLVFTLSYVRAVKKENDSLRVQLERERTTVSNLRGEVADRAFASEKQEVAQ